MQRLVAHYCFLALELLLSAAAGASGGCSWSSSGSFVCRVLGRVLPPPECNLGPALGAGRPPSAVGLGRGSVSEGDMGRSVK